jgi:hypothetical protein
MPATKRNDFERERDMAIVAEKLAMGWSQERIAQHLGFSRSQIRYDIKIVLERLRRDQLKHADRFIAKQLLRLDSIYCKAREHDDDPRFMEQAQRAIDRALQIGGVRLAGDGPQTVNVNILQGILSNEHGITQLGQLAVGLSDALRQPSGLRVDDQQGTLEARAALGPVESQAPGSGDRAHPAIGGIDAAAARQVGTDIQVFPGVVSADPSAQPGDSGDVL